MNRNNTINYIEFASNDLPASKVFFTGVFGWSFTDYGDSYSAFVSGTLEGGFYSADKNTPSIRCSPLVVLYHDNLSEIQKKIEDQGGVIVQAEFGFPGGRRFQFREPGGNELAVWCADQG